MKHSIFIVLLCLIFGSGVVAQALHPSAALEINSTDKGFLPPVMTTAQRDAITDPANGLLIFNITNQRINFYNEPISSWTEIGSAAINLNMTSTFTSATNFRVILTNPTDTTISPVFNTSDVTLSGLSGVTVTAVDDTAETIPPLGSHTVNFTLDYGSVSAVAPIPISASYSYGNQTTNSTFDNPTLLLHQGLFYDELTSTATGEIWLD